MKEKLLEYKNHIIILLIILGLIAFNIYTLTLTSISDEDKNQITLIDTRKKETKIKVDIKGEINAAGVYE